MKTLTKKWQLILYGCAGLGVNMLNMIVGSYLCSALLVGGFVKNVEHWTYLNKDIVVAGLWAVLILVAKVVDGIIDIPLSSLTDNLKTRWGRRRPAILIGFIPMIIAYVLFLIPIDTEATLLNTIWFGAMLCLFYCSYTLTMVTYYATFSEIVDNDRDRVFLSNCKSICDVVYFSLSFALVPLFVGMGVNIRNVAVIFLPLALTMIIPFFMIKEKSTKDGIEQSGNVVEGVNVFKSFGYAFRNKQFIFWLITVSVMNFGLQLFLSGINEFFSSTGLDMTIVMACSFAPIPFTLQLYNHFVKKKGLKFGFQYVLLVFSFGMLIMFFCRSLPANLLLPVAILGGVIVSFSIGAFFSITYTIPSQLAADENARTGVCASSMYFAVQGLFQGISTGIASGLVLVWLKQSGNIGWMTLIVAAGCMAAFVLAFFLPKSIAQLGKEISAEKA